MPTSATRQRCAIYTRKSSEEGLDQAFNSLDAQREACEAFIKSQASEGWTAVGTHYDDGGVSGGTLERPALQQLMEDIKQGKIETVVVYKVDRLTRSLADFAKLVEVFDANTVTFVSVTQQFNTTTSMGRLTLNMLLSFAQFEREVTGERIRDKIAASKRKGMWMGGPVPLGYGAKDRTLVVNEDEAATVRTVFALYREHGNVRLVKKHADRMALVTKLRVLADGHTQGGRPLSRGYIYKLLSNPLYVGRIAHKDETYPGQHEPIIDEATWDAVHETLASSAQRQRGGTGARVPSLLAGVLYDEHGVRLTPSHTAKSGKRYRYYVSHNLLRGATTTKGEGYRIPAHGIESLVTDTLTSLLRSRVRLYELLALDQHPPARLREALAKGEALAETLEHAVFDDRRPALHSLLDRVVVADAEVKLSLSIAALARALSVDPFAIDGAPCHWIAVPARPKRCGGASRMIISTDGAQRQPDPALLRVLSRAHRWFARLCSDEAPTIARIAEEEGFTRSYVARVVRLAFLAPDITAAIVGGEEPADLNAERLVRCPELPLSWSDQRRLFGA